MSELQNLLDDLRKKVFEIRQHNILTTGKSGTVTLKIGGEEHVLDLRTL